MEAPGPLHPEWPSSLHVLVRFVLRLFLVGTLAVFGTKNFGTTVVALLDLTALFCATLAVMRGEPVFARVLTHWDEAAAYGAIGRGIFLLS